MLQVNTVPAQAASILARRRLSEARRPRDADAAVAIQACVTVQFGGLGRLAARLTPK